MDASRGMRPPTCNLHGDSSEPQCLPESLKLKRTIVKELDDVADGETIIASNSSSYTIEEILENQSLKQPDRFTSLHSCTCFHIVLMLQCSNTDRFRDPDWPPETSGENSHLLSTQDLCTHP